MTKLINRKSLATLSLALSFVFSIAIGVLSIPASIKSNAAVNDDPGAGRLSGKNISDGFYDSNDTNNNFTALDMDIAIKKSCQ